MTSQNLKNTFATFGPAPRQLVLDVQVGCGVAANEESANSPSLDENSLESALFRDAQAHWRAVDRLTRDMRRRSRNRNSGKSAKGDRSEISIGAKANERAFPRKGVSGQSISSPQKTLWLSDDSNETGGGLASSSLGRQQNLCADSKTAKVAPRDHGLEICRHLIAALRLQHQRDQLRQANSEGQKSA